MFTLPQNTRPDEIEKLVNILNDKLTVSICSHLHDTIYKEVAILLQQNVRNYDNILNTIAHTLDSSSGEKLFFGGKMNMLNQPEFHNIDKIRTLMDMIDEEKGMYELFKQTPLGINVKIGRENQLRTMQDCSLNYSNLFHWRRTCWNNCNIRAN